MVENWIMRFSVFCRSIGCCLESNLSLKISCNYSSYKSCIEQGRFILFRFHTLQPRWKTWTPPLQPQCRCKEKRENTINFLLSSLCLPFSFHCSCIKPEEREYFRVVSLFQWQSRRLLQNMLNGSKTTLNYWLPLKCVSIAMHYSNWYLLLPQRSHCKYSRRRGMERPTHVFIWCSANFRLKEWNYSFQFSGFFFCFLCLFFTDYKSCVCSWEKWIKSRCDLTPVTT